MMRRTRPMAVSLSGNGILGIRREDKNVWERRVPLIPKQVEQLIKRKEVSKVVVQPSSTRCFNNRQYEEAGAEINEDLGECGTICAVKEVPPQLLLPDRSYMFFSHTIKAQAYNMPLLDTIIENNIRLLDYERINGPDGRLVKFGPYAGFAGMIDTLHMLGQAMLLRGFATPFVQTSFSKEYRSLETARADIRIAGDLIRQHGLPPEMCPLVIGVTGTGSVSLAAQEILHLLPCRYVEPDQLPRLWGQAKKDTNHIHVCVIKSKDMVVPKEEGKAFDSKEYYAHPENFRPVFHENIAPYLRCLVNGMYWEPRFPRLLTTAQAKALAQDDNFPLLALGDITCDIGGSVEFFVKATTIQNPIYAYDVESEETIDIQNYNGNGVVILGVDHLPAEFPCEASESFGEGLSPLVGKVVKSRADQPLDNQKKELGEELFGSMVTCEKSLTPHFEYINDIRKKRSEKSVDEKQRHVLVLGAGMVAGPCVSYLHKNARNTVTLVDASRTSLDTLTAKFGTNSAPDLGGEDKPSVRTRVADLSSVSTYLESLIKESDVVVSMLPATMHHIIAESTAAHKVPLVTASYVSPQLAELSSKMVENDTFVCAELGLDPGIDIMTSAKMIDGIKKQGGIVKSYVSLCGALPQPENSNCPLGYKFSWFPRGVLTAATRPARFQMNGKWEQIEGNDLYYHMSSILSFNALDLHWLPNGDAEKYKKLYGLEQAETVIRGTLRYSGFAPVIRAWKELGMLNLDKPLNELKSDTAEVITWASLMRKILPSEIAQTQSLTGDIASALSVAFEKTLKRLSTDSAYKAISESQVMGDKSGLRQAPSMERELSFIINTFKDLDLLNDHRIVPKTPTGLIIDSLCQVLIHKLKYAAHERDITLMVHRIVAEFPEKGVTRTYEATLARRGESLHNSATAVTVGYPPAIVAQRILDKHLDSKKGIVLPTDPEVYEPVLAELERLGIAMTETVTETATTQ